MLRLASRYKFLLFPLGVADYELSLLWLEVVALDPCVISPLGELFLEVSDCIDFVKVVEDFGLDLLFANLSLCDP